MVCLNGELASAEQAKLQLNDRGLLLGDGLFETLRASKECVYHFDLHWQRLQHGLKILEINNPLTETQLVNWLQKLLLLHNYSPASIRLTITRGYADRGLSPPLKEKPNYFITIHPLAAVNAPVALIVAKSVKKNQHSVSAQIKSLNYLDNVLARQEAERFGADEAVLLNTASYVADTPMANIFMVKNREIYTPRIEDGALPGIMRHCVIEIAKTLNYPVVEAQFGVDELLKADEVFLTNVLRKIIFVKKINECKFELSSNSIAGKLLSAYNNFYN